MRNSKRSTKPVATVTENVNTVTEPVTVPATVTIATPDPVASRRERIIADRQRAFDTYHGLALPVESIPVKALSAYKAKPAVRNPNNRSGLSLRAAAAALVAIVANGVRIPVTDGKPTEPTVTFARQFPIGDSTFVIENGCVGDMLSAGVATVSGTSPATETVTLRTADLIKHYAVSALREHGVIAD